VSAARVRRWDDVVFHLGQLAQAAVLLDEGLGDLALDGEDPLSFCCQLLAFGDVDGDDHVAGAGCSDSPPAGRSSGLACSSDGAAHRHQRRGPCASVDPSESSTTGSHGPHPHDATTLLAVLARSGPGTSATASGRRAETHCGGANRWSGAAHRSGRIDEVGNGSMPTIRLRNTRASVRHPLRRR